MKNLENLTIRKLNLNKDISNKYLNWMNDKNIHKYTEQKYIKHTLNSIRKFVKEKNESKNQFLYGIFINRNNLKIHIGNIKLGPINFVHKRSPISYFIGEKKFFGKGYATQAIEKIINVAKKKGLKKLTAGVYEMNAGSKIVLKKNNFKLEGKLKSQILHRGKRYDLYCYGKII